MEVRREASAIVILINSIRNVDTDCKPTVAERIFMALRRVSCVISAFAGMAMACMICLRQSSRPKGKLARLRQAPPDADFLPCVI